MIENDLLESKNSDGAVKARFWSVDGTEHVICHLCPHRCRIRVGDHGICRVRENHEQTLIAASYGKITSIALDPIEKKPLAGFKPGNKILSIGSYGCNFRCAFCQNWTLSQQKPSWRMISPGNLIRQAREMQSLGNIGLAFTYNEPLINYEYVYDCAKLARESGLHTVIVTNGSINPDPLDQLLPWVDAMNIDLKGWRPEFYKRYCGGLLEPVKETIQIAAHRCHIELTCLLIPGLNDDEADMDQMASWIASINPQIILHLTRHHPDYLMQKPDSISIERIKKLSAIASHHLKTVLLGNLF